MRAVHEGRAATDETFARFMDLCLVCRACEDVCPSHVPFGRMMEAARTQIEPLRSRRARFVRWLGLDVVLPSRRLTLDRGVPGPARAAAPPVAGPRARPQGTSRAGPTPRRSPNRSATPAGRSRSWPGASRTGGSAGSTSRRSGCSRGTAGVSSCRVIRRVAARWRRTTATSGRRGSSRARTHRRSRPWITSS